MGIHCRIYLQPSQHDSAQQQLGSPISPIISTAPCAGQDCSGWWHPFVTPMDEPFLDNRGYINTRYLKHIKVSIFKSIKVSDFLGHLFYFSFLEQQRRQRRYSLFLDGGLVRCRHCPSTNTCAWGNCFACGHIGDMMICIAPFATAWTRARTGAWARSKPWQEATPFSRQSVRAPRRGVVVVHELILLLEVIVFVVVSLLVGLKLEVLLFGTRGIIALIILMAAIVPAFIAIGWVTSMVVAVLGTMMPVVQSRLWATGRWAIFISFGCFFSLSFSRTLAAFLAVWHCSKKIMSQRGSVGTVLFASTNLNWCAFGCARKISSLSLVPWITPSFDEGNRCQDSWKAVLDAT